VSGDPPNTLTIEAPAKINVGLRVLGRRPDGYHDLQTVILPISLADTLTVHADAGPERFRTLSLSLEVDGDPTIARAVPVDETNLVLRAARALADRSDVRGFAEFHLRKRIPAAAGLGGGSSDAAAALLALNQVWRLGLRGRDLLGVASEVGSDVPALLARRPVRVSGRGERVALIAEAEQLAPRELLLVTFDFGVRTADAFGWWDQDGGPHVPAGADPWANDLEGPVLARHPRVREARDVLSAGGAAAAGMSGSGPSLVGVLPAGAAVEADALEALARLAGREPLAVHPWVDEAAEDAWRPA
jgi:4-diphosphocytidyl-2-C-methyl-D-erythritol kinase